jgi:hypothetical protein
MRDSAVMLLPYMTVDCQRRKDQTALLEFNFVSPFAACFLRLRNRRRKGKVGEKDEK